MYTTLKYHWFVYNHSCFFYLISKHTSANHTKKNSTTINYFTITSLHKVDVSDDPPASTSLYSAHHVMSRSFSPIIIRNYDFFRLCLGFSLYSSVLVSSLAFCFVTLHTMMLYYHLGYLCATWLYIRKAHYVPPALILKKVIDCNICNIVEKKKKLARWGLTYSHP